jgi:hypothetical protein
MVFLPQWTCLVMLSYSVFLDFFRIGFLCFRWSSSPSLRQIWALSSEEGSLLCASGGLSQEWSWRSFTGIVSNLISLLLCLYRMIYYGFVCSSLSCLIKLSSGSSWGGVVKTWTVLLPLNSDSFVYSLWTSVSLINFKYWLYSHIEKSSKSTKVNKNQNKRKYIRPIYGPYSNGISSFRVKILLAR